MEQLKTIEQVQVKKGTIKFEQFEELKKQAIQVSEWMQTVDTSEENIKEVKKVIANGRKAVKSLNDRRIEIKNNYMKPYLEFEEKIKEISGVIDEAESKLKVKVKEFEDAERAEKHEMVKKIYDFVMTDKVKSVAKFDWFMDQRFLNKTMSIDKIQVMAEKFNERIEEELKTIEEMEDAEKILIGYIEQEGDFAKAFSRYNETKRIEEQATRAMEERRKAMEEAEKAKQEEEARAAQEAAEQAEQAEQEEEVEEDPEEYEKVALIAEDFFEDDFENFKTMDEDPEEETEDDFVIIKIHGEFMAGIAMALLEKSEIEFEVVNERFEI